MRLVAGEIQIIVDPVGADHGVASAAWKAILQDGSLVAPGTADTLKYDNATKINTDVGVGGSYSQLLESIAPAAGVTVPPLLAQLALAPGTTGLMGDRFYYDSTSERFPYRGGRWYSTSSAGVFACDLSYPRSSTYTYVGFRPSFVSVI
jgi:hypothetical protein